MDFIKYFSIFDYLLLLLCVLLCYLVYTKSTNKRRYNLPPGPSGLPIVGILPFLSDKPHLDFIDLGKKYGGIFSIYLGRKYVVVVTDAELGIQLLGKTTTTDRPPDMFHSMPDGTGFASANGAEWMEQRRFTMMEMKNLGFGQSYWEKIVQMDISDILKFVEESHGEPVDIEEPLSLSISNSVLSLVTSRRIYKGDPRREIIENGIKSFQHLHTQANLISFYPKLFKFAVNVGILKAGHKLQDLFNMNKCVRQEIEETKKNRGDGSFIEKYLDEIEKNKKLKKETSFNDTTLLGNIQALIIAGSHTTRIALQYLLLAMATYPEIQAKVHEELDREVGKDGFIEWADRKKVPYCFATILEGQRWRTITPLNLIHVTNADVEINGYEIPKGTSILTVLWAFHYDTKYWKDPETFEPARFLSEDGKTVSEPKAFIPFSHGKRTCPGKIVALIQLFQYFVSIMRKFQVLPVSKSQQPDLDGILGLTLMPKPQSLRFVLR